VVERKKNGPRIAVCPCCGGIAVGLENRWEEFARWRALVEQAETPESEPPRKGPSFWRTVLIGLAVITLIRIIFGWI